MNIAIFSGRITADPVKRETASKIPVTSFRIAVPRPNTPKENKITDYFDCVAWQGRAETIERFFHKGDGITVRGSIFNKEWQDKDGNKHTGVELHVDEFEFPLTRRTAGTADVKPETEKPAGYVESDNEPLPF